MKGSYFISKSQDNCKCRKVESTWVCCTDACTGGQFLTLLWCIKP